MVRAKTFLLLFVKPRNDTEQRRGMRLLLLQLSVKFLRMTLDPEEEFAVTITTA
jgi:hypothetical protein